MNLSYSNHAIARIQQRGMRGKDIEILQRLRSVRVVLGKDGTVISAYHLDRKIEKSLLRGVHKHTSKARHHKNR